MKFELDHGICLELTAEQHAQGLLDAVNTNRKHLGTFLPWVSQMKTVDNFRDYIRNCQQLYAEGKEVSFVIMKTGNVIGRVGIHHINQANANGEIGYWLTQHATGKGIITNSCRIMIAYGFEKMDLHRIVIKAATDNIQSRKIPENLGFTFEGISREAEKVNGRFLDLAVYAILRQEWNPTQNYFRSF